MCSSDLGTSKNDPRSADATKEISGKLIEFEAGDINITAQEMTIRADEIVDNSDIAGGGDAVGMSWPDLWGAGI